ncbi:MAG: hypothetical protein ACI4JF_04990 [Oscillospiraceae bacterium]
MKIFTEDFVSISERPQIIQSDGQPVLPEAAEYIYNGEPCDFDGEIHTALKKHIHRGRFVSVVMMVFVAVCGAAFAASSFRSGAPRTFQDETDSAFFLVLGIMLMALALLMWWLYNRKTAALKAAKSGNIRCFRYKYYQKLRYEYKDIDRDTLYDYYADLGGFCVDIPKKAAYVPYAVGAVISVGGKDCFYLLV